LGGGPWAGNLAEVEAGSPETGPSPWSPPVIFDPCNSSFFTAVKIYANGIVAALARWILRIHWLDVEKSLCLYGPAMLYCI